MRNHLAAYFKDVWRGIRDPQVWGLTAAFALTVLLGYLLINAHDTGTIIVGAIGYAAAVFVLYTLARRLTR